MTKFTVCFKQYEKDGNEYSDSIDTFNTEVEADQAIVDAKQQDEIIMDWDKIESITYWINEE